MHISIVRFPTLTAELDKDYRDWFASSNDQLRGTAGLKGRRLLPSASTPLRTAVRIRPPKLMCTFTVERSAGAGSARFSAIQCGYHTKGTPS